MKRTVIVCDKCNRGDDDDIVVVSYRFDCGSEMDPSGNGYITNWDYCDYCNDCYHIEREKRNTKVQRETIGRFVTL